MGGISPPENTFLPSSIFLYLSLNAVSWNFEYLVISVIFRLGTVVFFYIKNDGRSTYHIHLFGSMDCLGGLLFYVRGAFVV
jgi:hypothetical protein